MRRLALPLPRAARLVALALLMVLTGCGGSEDEGEGRRGGGRYGRGGGPSVTPAVEVIQAQRGALPLEERLSGVVRARNQVDIFAEINAPVEAVLVQDGDRVTEGQALARLRDRGLRDQLRQAQATLTSARADVRAAEAQLQDAQAQYERTKKLVDKNYESQQRLEQVEGQRDAAQATLEQARAQVEQAEATVAERRQALGQTVVRSPVTGRVGRRNAEPGMRAGPDTRLFTVGDLDRVLVEVAVTEGMFAQIRTGQTARLSAPSLPDTVIAAEVARISPFLDEGSFSAQAEIEVDNRGGVLRPGMFVQVDVAYGESQQATVVPKSVLYENPQTGQTGVFVAPTLGTETPVDPVEDVDPENPPALTDAMQVQFRPVEVVAEGRQLVGITGVGSGDWVVAVGQNLLRARGDQPATARIRAVTWQRIVELQGLQQQDLLLQFMEKQQRLARQQTTDSVEATADPARVAEDPPASTAAPADAPVATSDTSGVGETG